MKESKIAQLIASLEVSLQNRFREHIKGKHSGSVVVVQLLRVIPRLVKRSAPLTVGVLTDAVGASTGSVKNALSTLGRELLVFLSLQLLTENNRLNHILAFEFAVNHHLNDLAHSLSKKVEQFYASDTIRSSSSVYDYLRYTKSLQRLKTEVTNDISVQSLWNTYHTIDTYYAAEVNKLRLSIQGYLNIFRPEELDGADQEKLNTLQNTLEKKSPEQKAPTSLYAHLTEIVETDAPQSFRVIYDRLEHLLQQESDDDLTLIINILCNHLSRQINMGDEEVVPRYCDLIGLISHGKPHLINEWRLKNFVTILCRNGQEKEASNLLRQVIPFLPADRAKGSEAYNAGVIARYQLQFARASRLFNLIDVEDEHYYLGARFNLINILYQEKDYEGASSLARSLKRHLKHYAKLDDNLIAANINFLNRLDGLIDIKANYDFLTTEQRDKKINKLRTALRASDHIVNRAWLFEEIDRLNSRDPAP